MEGVVRMHITHSDTRQMMGNTIINIQIVLKDLWEKGDINSDWKVGGEDSIKDPTMTSQVDN